MLCVGKKMIMRYAMGMVKRTSCEIMTSDGEAVIMMIKRVKMLIYDDSVDDAFILCDKGRSL